MQREARHYYRSSWLATLASSRSSTRVKPGYLLFVEAGPQLAVERDGRVA